MLLQMVLTWVWADSSLCCIRGCLRVLRCVKFIRWKLLIHREWEARHCLSAEHQLQVCGEKGYARCLPSKLVWRHRDPSKTLRQGLCVIKISDRVKPNAST